MAQSQTTQPETKRSPPEKPAELKRSKQTKGWDTVDEASWESFPASDPPAHWAGSDAEPPTLNGEPISDEPELPASKPGNAEKKRPSRSTQR